MRPEGRVCECGRGIVLGRRCPYCRPTEPLTAEEELRLFGTPEEQAARQREWQRWHEEEMARWRAENPDGEEPEMPF